MDKPKKLNYPILFVTRTYPPVIGGMEILSFNLTKKIAEFAETYIIKNSYGRKNLPFFIPWATIKAIILVFFKKIKLVHLSDGVLAPVGMVLKTLFPRIKVVSNIHGLDLAYAEQLRLYSYTNIWAIRRLDRIFAVSNDVKTVCLKYGIDVNKITVIPNGTNAEEFYLPDIRNNKKRKLWEKYFPAVAESIDPEENFIILSLGRIVKRKGLAWFIKDVMPDLPKRAVLVIASSGPDEEKVRQTVNDGGMQNRVLFLGFVTEKEKKFLLNGCDILVMPNIKTPGDREGFGITAIEAGSCELVPVVADLEGLKDAIEDHKNGLRLPSKNKAKFVETIKYLIDNPKYRIELGRKARRHVKENFDWSVIGRKYLEEFRKLEP